jgi:hypothetical protein
VFVGVDVGNTLQLPHEDDSAIISSTLQFDEILLLVPLYVTHIRLPLIITDIVMPVVTGVPE